MPTQQALKVLRSFEDGALLCYLIAWNWLLVLFIVRLRFCSLLPLTTHLPYTPLLTVLYFLHL